MKNALFSNRSIVAPISFGIGLFLLLTVLVNPIYVLASSNPQIDIPFTAERSASLNNWFSDNFSILENDSNVSSILSDSDYVLVPIDLDYYGTNYDDWSWWWITIIAIPVEEFSDPVSDNLFTSALSPTLVSGKDCYIFKLWIDDMGNYNSNVQDFDIYYYPSDRYIFGSHNSQSIASLYDFVNSYPVYWQKNFYSSNDTLILKYSFGSISVEGHAVAPSFETSGHSGSGVGGSEFLGTFADFGHAVANSTMPSSPTYNSFNFNVYSPPSFDDSSILDALSSIADILIYTGNFLVSNILGAITTLMSNIQIAIGYIGDLIKYGLRILITNIQNGIQNLFENIVSLFEPVLNFVSEVLSGVKTIVDQIIFLGTDENGNFSLTTLFVNLAIPSESDLQDAVSDSDTFGLIGVATSVNSKILSEVNTLKGLSSSKIIHVPSCYFHGVQIGDYDIDFSWYDNYKSLGDGIISSFLIWNYIWFLFFRLPSFIRGQGGAFVSDINSATDYGKH